MLGGIKKLLIIPSDIESQEYNEQQKEEAKTPEGDGKEEGIILVP